MMDIERVNGYSDPRFPQEVLHQHGAFLADGVPWAFRVVSDRWEVDIDALQPSQFSVDEDKRAAVDGFLYTAADLVIPVTELADGTLCTMDGHTRLYTAWRKGIRRAMVFRASDQDMAAGIADFAAEARKRGIFHIRDMALLSHEEQEEKWDGWCDAWFAAQGEAT